MSHRTTEIAIDILFGSISFALLCFLKYERLKRAEIHDSGMIFHGNFGYYVIYRLDLKSTFKLFDLCKMPKPFKSTSYSHLAKRKRKRNCDLNQIIIVTPRPIRISFEV